MNEKLFQKLIASGLNVGLATIIATNAKAEMTDTEIDTITKQISDGMAAANQSEIDRRVTQAVKTGIENYEKKFGIKEGKPIEQKEVPGQIKTNEPIKLPENTPPTNNTNSTNPEIKALMEIIAKQNESIAKLHTGFEGMQKQKSLEERNAKIKTLLSDAKIPEPLQKRFSVSEEATDEEILTSISSYKQELVDVGLAGLFTPGNGKTKEVSEKVAEEAAKARNDASNNTGIFPGKKL